MKFLEKIKEVHNEFPCYQDMIDFRLNEAIKRHTMLEKEYSDEKARYGREYSNEFDIWLGKWGIDFVLEPIIKRYEREIFRLRALSRVKPKIKKNEITEDMIIMASEVPIGNFIELYPAGNNLIALCPFHKEKTASFVVYPNNHYYCFGCHCSGDVINFYMKKFNRNFIESVRELTNN